MSLEALTDLMRHACEQGYAIGYFESWNIESLQGVVDAAEETRSPIILGFSGDFLSRPDRLADERISWYGQLGKAAAESARVPCGLIFNECPFDDWVGQSIECGFNIVSMADPEARPADYVRRVSEITAAAHQRQVGVEAEVGELPCGVDEADHKGNGMLTTPEAAAEFVEATGVDLLAVSVGNVHIMLEGHNGLDLERLAEIHQSIDIPLVLHGGSGISSDALTAAISLGVHKVNYGTYLKQRYLHAIREALLAVSDNPHRLLGIGGSEDVMAAGRLAVREAGLERIGQLGCCGKA